MALVKKIQRGDMDAREYMVNCNLKFAFMIAKKYARTGLPLLDLVQQANIGLMDAVDKYNPNRGTAMRIRLRGHRVFLLFLKETELLSASRA